MSEIPRFSDEETRLMPSDTGYYVLFADHLKELEGQQQKFEEHTKAVGRFLTSMYQFMVDPVEDPDPGLTVKEMCDLLLHAASENRQALQDQIDRAGNLPANWKEDSSLETWFPLTAEEIKQLRAQLRSKDEQLAGMRAEITVAQLKRAGCQGLAAISARPAINRILHERAALSGPSPAPPEGGK